jgi:hypothetical protein
MKQNKFNLQQMKGYFNDFIYTIELPGIDKYNCHIIYVKIFNLNGINVAEYLIKVTSKRKYKKIFHRVIKFIPEEIERYIQSLEFEDCVDDDCYTRSATIWHIR